jgi:hypothetical protein
MRLRPGISLAVAGGALLVTAQAFAWHEEHLAGDEAHIRVDPRGMASVEHLLRWRVVHGPLKSIDVAGVDMGAVLDPAAAVRTEDGRAFTARVVRGDDSVVRVMVDSPQALTRGVATFDVRWQIDLVATGTIVPDGASWRLSWSLPAAANGFDLPRVTLDLPAGSEPPRSLGVDLNAPEAAAGETDTLRRDRDRDILEIVRPYAAHGETVTGVIRLDPRALHQVVDPRLRPVAPPSASGDPRRWQEGAWLGALVVVGTAFGLLVARKDRAFGAACGPAWTSARGLLPLTGALRATIAGLALAMGAALQIGGQPMAGGLLIALSVLSSALRCPRIGSVARGPGQWFPLRPEDAFRRSGADGLLGHIPWRVGLGALTFLGVTWAAGRLSPQGPWLVVMDCAPVVALLATGRSSQRPAVDLEGAGQLLRRPFSLLKATANLRVVPWGRVALDGTIDELRIRVLPRAPVPGLVGIEMGHAWSRTPVGWAPAGEVMVRVLEGSAAAAKIGRAMPEARQVPGRRAQERVLRLAPSMPTDAACRALVGRAADILTDRRVTSDSFKQGGAERRRLFPVLAVCGETPDWGPSIVDATC